MSNFPTRQSLSLLLGAFFLTAALLPAADFSVEEGTLGAAKYTIVMPTKWNGRLLLVAHGLRPVTAPVTSEFDYQDGTPFATLLKQGWIIASTSYRRNGWIVEEAVEDLENLRKHVVEKHGSPSLTLVSGTSMGGVIALHLAETADPKHYQGLLAIAAALNGDAGTSDKLSHRPLVPLLFLSNQDEAANPRAYVEASMKAAPPPVLWTVARDGHANLTPAEYTEGLQALLRWIETGKIEANKDATIAATAPPSTAVIKDQRALVTVTSVDPVYGNFVTDMVEPDLIQIGLKKGDAFQVSFQKSKAVGHWVASFGKVPQGEWLALVTAEGRVQFARNMTNAAQALGVKAGDKIEVSATKP